MYVERFLEGVRHIEVQVLSDGADSHLHLGERDCTLQRRSQKLLEEAPSGVSAATRAAMGEAAVTLARNIGYRSAGTVEFVYDPKTESITGIDIVAEQLRVSGGEGLSMTQTGVRLTGHAIECRINAEDTAANFRPMPGQITRWKPPSGDGVRIDSHVYEGYRIRGALADFEIEGVPTTRAFHLQVLADPRFVSNTVDTKWVEREFLPAPSPV
ncbi:MAG: hypothetical protein NVSMB21_26210 [Vulcanimicrobiaceae bacterium]